MAQSTTLGPHHQDFMSNVSSSSFFYNCEYEHSPRTAICISQAVAALYEYEYYTRRSSVIACRACDPHTSNATSTCSLPTLWLPNTREAPRILPTAPTATCHPESRNVMSSV